MSTLLISSSEDPASTLIKQCLLERTAWEEHGGFFNAPVYRLRRSQDIYLVTIPDKKIRHEDIDSEIKDHLHLTPSVAIFLSRHRSKMGAPTLTVHPIGNYGEALYGGKPHTLISSAPRMMTHLLRLVTQQVRSTALEYNVCFEVTHHGPFLRPPTLFVEVGSTEVQWAQKEPADIIAGSLLDLLTSYTREEEYPKTIPVLLGIGGGHYAPRFTDLALEKNIAFGHMIPTYQIDQGTINEQMLQQAFQSTPDACGVYLHKKELKKSQVTTLKHWCQAIGIPVLSSKEFVDL